MRNFITKLLLVVLTFITAINVINVNAKEVNIEPDSIHNVVYDTNSAYYGKVDDKTKISNPDSSVLSGYFMVAEADGLKLYLNRNKLNIAVETESGYIFYSNPDYYGYDMTAYLTTGGLAEISTTTLAIDGMYSTSIKKNNKPKITYDFESVPNGFKASINFDVIGIIVNVYVKISNGKIEVEVPISEIVEAGYDKETQSFVLDENGNRIKENGKYVMETSIEHYDYVLGSFTLFPYFGSVGFSSSFDNRINGYDFIPDGSGALSRFQYDRVYSTQYQKRVYGNDYGIQEDSSLTQHLSDDTIVSLPIFGVSHGYNQNAFLCVIEEGAGNANLVLEPFGYFGRNIQSTYFKFLLREKYNVFIATSESGMTTTLPSSMYNTNIKFSYNFLYNDEASYSGMAKYYRENYLNLKENDISGSVPLGLNVLAQDYKKGLFGKNFVEMTTYEDLLNIVKDLENNGVENFSISYKGWNKKGYYNNPSNKPKISLNLGSKKDYFELVNYLVNKGYDFASCIDILSSYNQSKKGVVKKYNLNLFEKKSESSLFDSTYLLSPVGVSKSVLDYTNKYNKYLISSINLESFSLNNYSYRYKSKNYSRDESISFAKEELQKIANEFDVSLVGANAYAYDALSRYYNCETSSSGYTYMSDSIPFVSLVLSGNVELFSKEINFIADYDQYCLRLIEYNIYPYFSITKENSSSLRYTNSENLFTSEYDLWKEKMISFYSIINEALKPVRGASMVSHEYISQGVALITYSNGYKVYVNHNNSPVSIGSINLNGLSFEVVL